MAAKSREAISSSTDFLTLHQQIKELTLPKFLELKRLLEKREGGLSLTEEENKQCVGLKGEAEKLILSKAEVIACTCSGAFDPRLRKFLFTQVLIDEATQATEPECLLPILTGA